MIKYLILAAVLLPTSVTAFTVGRIPQTVSNHGLFEKINSKIDLDSAKVVNMETCEAGDKKVFCRCWKSGTFPLCDAAHVEHNKATGDNVGPLIVSGPKKEKDE